MPIFIDQLNIAHSFLKTPSRIVSLVPSQTELLFDLGLEENIVGITKFCVHPNHLKITKTIIGGTKKVFFEKIKMLQPDIIIGNKEENTIEIIEKLTSICPVWITNIITIEDNLEMIVQFGNLFNKQTEAQILVNKINLSYLNFREFVKDKPKLNAAYFIWKNPYMVAGSENFINEMLKINNFKNVFQDKKRYPEVELQNIELQEQIDLILLSSEPFPFKQEDAFEIQKFNQKVKIVFVDGEMFSWYGSRILKAFEYFKMFHQKL